MSAGDLALLRCGYAERQRSQMRKSSSALLGHGRVQILRRLRKGETAASFEASVRRKLRMQAKSYYS